MLMRRAALGVRMLPIALLLATNWAGALEVVGNPEVTGSAGEYATLGFRLIGVGEYAFTVTSPDGWVPLSRTGRVTVDRTGFVSVTVRVPGSAPAGSVAQVRIDFESTAPGTEGATGIGNVIVASHVAIELLAPRDMVGQLGQPHELTLVVRNRGNMPDVVDLSGEGGMWDVRLERSSVALEVGAEAEVLVTLLPRGSVSSGYRHVLWLTGVSRNDPLVRARAFTETVFRDSSLETERAAGQDPRLALSFRTGVTGGVTIDEAGTDYSLRYDVNPRLSGELSDYVSVTAGVGSLSGSLQDPFERVPSQLSLGLTATSWDAAASFGDGTYALSGGALLGQWRFGTGATYAVRDQAERFGVSVSAVSQVPGLDLQFVGRTTTTSGTRHDSLGARYRTPLADGLNLTLGADLVGSITPDGYAVAVGVSESLTFQVQAFDVTQTYNAVPQAGLHNIGLSGGLRSAGPFGLRAATSLSVSPAGNRWRNSLTLSTAPAAGLNLAVTGTYAVEAAGASFSVRPTLGYRYRIAAANGNVSVGYAYTVPLWGLDASSNRLSTAGSLYVGPFSVSVAASYLLTGSGRETEAGANFSVEASAEYRLSARSGLGAAYEYESDTVSGVSTASAALSWNHSWSTDLASSLSYEREQSLTYGTGAYSQTERIALIGQVNDLFVDGLTLSAGYSLRSAGGLFTGAPLQHAVSARLGYTFAIRFDTPDPVTQLFGGRRGGEVRGVAFIDRDLDGARGEHEELLSDLTVALGGVATVTGPDGKFRLRVPEGQHPFAFTAGVPAGFAPRLPDDVRVSENEVYEIDLPFVPVANVTVTLFDDLDNDGVRGPDEGGIAFGGVIIEGPEEHRVRMDARGVATVTGLVPGRYLVRPDPEQLPARYRATTEPYGLVVREGQRPAPISVGAGAPPRQVVTTFTTASLAIIGRASTGVVEAGGQIDVSALVSGPVQRVTAELAGTVYELTQGPGGWLGTLTLSADVAPGRSVILLRAYGGGAEAVNEVPITVRAPTDEP